VSRTTILVLIALGAAIAGFAFSSTARRGGDAAPDASRSAAARPQKAVLGWVETYGEGGSQLVFSVESLEILSGGWRAEVGLENRTNTSYEVVATQDHPFGLMLFSTSDHDELVAQNEAGTLPTIRPASRYAPKPPAILEPGDAWAGTISAPGALVANSYVRVVFGALVSVVEPREGLTWITDRAHKLEP
jgi:hypothetical protein